ncbi:carbohydrate esterase family 4 protein [Suillus subalutaceus]|uniref:carbohydrate esterase family 4 protein n=1 Tax=Suillus subalutaceus TaxID=48586 RepID=UPI001B87A957|nr:carbohydrate esterase family 4 protein [Suillus subalutaceus]KAG1857346.1 carbohydrate esterase family 4 protein [Suillus subalutaceus]
MPREILIGFGVDVDAVAGWIGSYGGEDSPLDISRGMYAGEVGVWRVLKLLDKYNIKATWFIPGHSLETFPNEMAAVRDAGHEIGLHGYSHENPDSLTPEQQLPPKGNVAPWWQTSKEGVALLLEKGIEYDHSNMSRDSQAHYLRDQDTWTKIDYKAKAHTWMKPLQRGKETGLVEIPASWYQEDMTPMMLAVILMDGQAKHGTIVTPQAIEQLWKDTFTYLYREEQDFIFPLSIHPDVSGRPQVLLMLERFIEWINAHDDVKWVTFHEMAERFRAKNDPPPGAVMPKGYVKCKARL